jgi:hypothetical protein
VKHIVIEMAVTRVARYIPRLAGRLNPSHPYIPSMYGL